ncbi:MAG: chemotaxis protein CheY [candidate division Zixibacteria bacterium DG_27]|nr:MAG: chemotaxis protein CheY [candidate division Zixibacteria bacterium DG_27]
MKNILIVDDEEDLARLYKKELSEEGYQVAVARSGEEAFEVAGKQEVNLVVLDIKLPRENGLEVLDRLKREDNHLPVILNSAYSTYKGDFSSWLADAYVVKSPNLNELKGRIRELLKM